MLGEGIGLEEAGVSGKVGADRAIRYLQRSGIDEGSGTSQVGEATGLSRRT